MDVLYFGGHQYHITQRYRWVDSLSIIASVSLQEVLSKMYSEKITLALTETNSFQNQWNLFDNSPSPAPDFTKCDITNIVKLADNYRQSSSFYRALLCFEYIVDHADIRTLLSIFPRMTSCYRKLGLPKRAISLAGRSRTRFGDEILTAPLLTSVGAAYCDMKQFYNADTCFKKALVISNNAPSSELEAALERLEHLSGKMFNRT